MKFVMKPFSELINLTKDQLAALTQPLRVRKVKAKADLEMIALETKILEQQEKLQKLVLEEDIDFKKIIQVLNENALTEREKGLYEEILAQLGLLAAPAVETPAA